PPVGPSASIPTRDDLTDASRTARHRGHGSRRERQDRGGAGAGAALRLRVPGCRRFPRGPGQGADGFRRGADRCGARALGGGAGRSAAPAGGTRTLDRARLVRPARGAPPAPARQRRSTAIRVPASAAARDRGPTGRAHGPLHAAGTAREPAGRAAGAGGGTGRGGGGGGSAIGRSGGTRRRGAGDVTARYLTRKIGRQVSRT